MKLQENVVSLVIKRKPIAFQPRIYITFLLLFLHEKSIFVKFLQNTPPNEVCGRTLR